MKAIEWLKGLTVRTENDTKVVCTATAQTPKDKIGCPDCAGSGIEPNDTHPCLECQGVGFVDPYPTQAGPDGW